MICSECGFENGGNAKFCNECGRSLVAAAEGKAPGLSADSPFPSAGTAYEGGPVPAPATETAPLDLPSIFEMGTDNDDFGFDFSPIDDDGPLYPGAPYAQDIPSKTQSRDISGFDEYLIGSDYVPPQKSWEAGGTLEMPRVEDKPIEQKEYRAPDHEEGRRPRRIAVAIILLLAAATIIAVSAVTYHMEMWGGKSLPDVEGMARPDAVSLLEERGFTVKSMSVKSDDQEDIVLLMDPGAGRRLSEGSEVVLQVSTSRVIPEVVGLTLEEAEAAFAQEGFERIEYEKVKSDAAESTILSIEPASGQKAKASTPIKVAVADPYVVPEVAGKDAASATEAVEAAGFDAAVVYIYSEQEEGTVIQSDPASGTKLASGSTVTIQIAKSRAKELIGVTQAYLGYLEGIGSLEIGGTTYEFIPSESYSISYTGGNTTVATITVVGVTTLADGEVVRGAQKQRTITFNWGDDNSLLSYA